MYHFRRICGSTIKIEEMGFFFATQHNFFTHLKSKVSGLRKLLIFLNHKWELLILSYETIAKLSLNILVSIL